MNTSTKPYGGLILAIRETERSEIIRDRIRREDRFTAAISSRDHKPKEFDTYLISLDGKALDFVCLARSGSGITTGSRRVTFLKFADLAGLLIEELEMSADTKAQVAEILTRDACRLPGEIWAVLTTAIKKARPTAAKDIDEIEEIRKTPRTIATDDAQRIIAEERDSVGLAAKIFGLNQNDVFARVNPETDPIL